MLTFLPPAFADESANGYFLRLAQENFVGSPSALFRAAGVRFKARYSAAELETLSEVLGIDHSGLGKLAGFPKVVGGLSQGRFLRTSTVPVCVECLRTSKYIRQVWHHQMCTACPEHRAALMHYCPECSEPLDLKRHCLATCRCGYDLTAADTQPAEPESLWMADLLLTDGAALLPGLQEKSEDLDEFLLFLANLTLAEPHRKNAPLSLDKAQDVCRAAYQIGRDLLPSFRAWVEARVEATNRMQSSRFMRNLGTWYHELNARFSEAAYSPVREIANQVVLEKAIAPINRKIKQIGAERLGQKGTLTANEAARTLKSSPDRIFALVKSGELEGKILQGATTEFCLVTQDAVKAHQLAAADFIYGKDMQKLLGMSRCTRVRMAELGLLCPVPEKERPPFARGEYRQSEAQNVLKRLTESCPEIIEPPSSLSLTEISGRRFSAEQSNEIFRNIFSGAFPPLGRLPGAPGFSGLRWDEKAVKALVLRAPAPVEFSVTELAKLTGWKCDTIRALIDRRYLPASVRNGRPYISAEGLCRFSSSYVLLADVASRLGSLSVWLAPLMKKAGVLVTDPAGEIVAPLLLSIDALVNVVSERAPTWSRPSKPQHPTGQSLVLKAVVDNFCDRLEVECG